MTYNRECQDTVNKKKEYKKNQIVSNHFSGNERHYNKLIICHILKKIILTNGLLFLCLSLYLTVWDSKWPTNLWWKILGTTSAQTNSFKWKKNMHLNLKSSPFSIYNEVKGCASTEIQPSSQTSTWPPENIVKNLIKTGQKKTKWTFISPPRSLRRWTSS